MIRRLASAAVALLLLGSTAPVARAANEVFVANCAVCHGEDGKAQTEQGKKKKARDFTDKAWQKSVDDARLEKSITKGHDKMPAFGKKLSADEIKTLVAEVRSFAK